MGEWGHGLIWERLRVLGDGVGLKEEVRGNRVNDFVHL